MATRAACLPVFGASSREKGVLGQTNIFYNNFGCRLRIDALRRVGHNCQGRCASAQTQQRRSRQCNMHSTRRHAMKMRDTLLECLGSSLADGAPRLLFGGKGAGGPFCAAQKQSTAHDGKHPHCNFGIPSPLLDRHALEPQPVHAMTKSSRTSHSRNRQQKQAPIFIWCSCRALFVHTSLTISLAAHIQGVA